MRGLISRFNEFCPEVLLVKDATQVMSDVPLGGLGTSMLKGFSLHSYFYINVYAYETLYNYLLPYNTCTINFHLYFVLGVILLKII